MLRIALKRSHIGIPQKQRRVLEALGLKKIGRSVKKADDDSTRGMINKVSHLITVEKIEE
ncbi:MAG: 50S ribosomal protein L30 [Candidatus Sulfobium sp.]|jgi:large subunit ribosomal protein L30